MSRRWGPSGDSEGLKAGGFYQMLGSLLCCLLISEFFFRGVFEFWHTA